LLVSYLEVVIMTYLPTLLDFDQCTPVRVNDEKSAQKLRVHTSVEHVGAGATTPVEATAAKAWTAQEIALATFWVAG
jgi:hypothetical protein